MSQLFPGFVGPSYQLASKYATIERTVNWMLTANEAASEESKCKLAFEPAPGNQAFCTLPVPAPFNQPNRGLLENRGVAFGVNGTVVFKIDQHGNFTNIGPVVSDGKPCSMVANGNGQIFIASAGLGYVIPPVPSAGSLIPIPTDPVNGPFFGASYATFQDGYIIVVTPGTNQFQISGSQDVPVGDATLWDASNISIQAGQADNLQAILSSREYLRLLGFRRSQVYADIGNSGNGGFPFQSYNETFIETGINAPFSLVDMGESLMWIGEDARGVRACWRDAAFQPQRVSTFAVERIWQGYQKTSDAIAFSYIWNGHQIYRITFPSAFIASQGFPLGNPVITYYPATWEYDATLSNLLQRPIWYERQFSNSQGTLIGRPERFHCFAYGKHLVGSNGDDGNPGAIYQMSNAMQNLASPNPQILLRWSNDGGNTFGPEYNLPVGQVGQYGIRVYWNRNGYARDRVYWLRVADPSLTECGTDSGGNQIQKQIVMDRICPHLWSTNKRIMFNRIEFELTRAPGFGSNPWCLVNAELDLMELAS